ncbi:MFS transporter [Candidatus Cyanaurora vandensis]|uniref:MFS transporter n=1 Tax=Candidatus Cyanaurora vandensis TaxID=2714958 RepID=UPI00257BBA5F|nr:MFS transporter [Candidatus Cyanaurora vandensis]
MEQPLTTVGFGDLLRNRNFLLLWAGQVFSQLADKIFYVLVIALVSRYFGQGGNLNSLISSVSIALSVPAILFGSLAGVFVDRTSKRWMLVGTNVGRGLLVLALSVLPQDFMVLLVLTFLVSTLTQFFAPAETATIPLILDRSYLLAANSLFTTTMMGSVILGFAVGEPLLALVGVDHGDWLVGGAYLVAALCLIMMRTGEQQEAKLPSATSVLTDLKEGLAYVWAVRPVFAALVQLIVLFSIFAALSVLAVSLGQSVGLKGEQFGFLLAMAGVGMAVGAWAVGRFGHGFSRAQLAFVGTLGMASTLAALGLVSNLWLALSLCTLLGLAAALVGVPMQTVIQEETPPELRGKVFGLQNNLVNIALSVPLGVAGVAADAFGLRPVILTTAFVVLLSAFVLQASNRIVKT